MIGNVSKGTESLHEALLGTGGEYGGIRLRAARLLPQLQQLGAFRLAEVHVRVVDQGGEVVLPPPEAHALEINQPSLAVAEHDVLALAVAVHGAPRQGCKPIGKLTQRGAG